MPEEKAEAHSPLAGVRVTEFCSIAAGPFCGMLLADMGAEVVKVEPPEGDAMRQWPPISEGYSENFASLNRNKKSVALDLKDAASAELARRIALDGDVVIENNRPGVMERLGLGYARLSRERPALVYCSISAFGQEGPRATEGGFDLTVQAASGVMSVTGEPEGPPVKCGVPIADFTSGLYGAYAIAAALAAVRHGARGTHIDVPMFGCTLAVGALQTSEYFGTGRNPRKLGSAHPRNAPYQAYRACDGFFAIAAGNQGLWLKVVAAVGKPELTNDARFASTRERAANQAALKEILEARFGQESVEHWVRVFADAGVPHSRINDYGAALADPQVEHMRWVQPIELPNGVLTKTFGFPLRLDGAPRALGERPPALGEHTEEFRARYATADLAR